MAVARVASRVAEGGHNIPKETIHRRYWLGLNNLFEIFVPIVDSWALYDNADLMHPIARDNKVLDETKLKNILLCLQKKK